VIFTVSSGLTSSSSLWLGSYIPDSSINCDINNCCCPTGVLSITPALHVGFLTFSSKLKGKCSAAQRAVRTNIRVPSDSFHYTGIIGNDRNSQLILSSNGENLQKINSKDNKCNTNFIKSHGATGSFEAEIDEAIQIPDINSKEKEEIVLPPASSASAELFPSASINKHPRRKSSSGHKSYHVEVEVNA